MTVPSSVDEWYDVERSMPFFLFDAAQREAWETFAEYVREFLPAEERGTDVWLSDRKLTDEGVRRQAVEWAKQTFVARETLRRYLENEGAEQEWERLLRAVRPTTRLLLMQLRERFGARSLAEVLQHNIAETLLHDEQLEELQAVRPEIVLTLHKEKPEGLIAHQSVAQEVLKVFSERAAALSGAEAQAFAERVYVFGEK